MTKRKYTHYDYEYGDYPPKKKSLTQRLEERVNADLKRIEDKEYRKKKRKLDDIKEQEEM
jgi:hypothetical protein